VDRVLVGLGHEIPTQWLAPPYKKVMLMTPSGHSITVDDTPGVGGITLQTAEGAKVVLSSTGCQFTNGRAQPSSSPDRRSRSTTAHWT
jgi:hypothetical protein